MPRPVMFDCITCAQGKETVEKEIDAKEKWIKANKNGIWQQAMGPIQGRITCICEDKAQLLRKLMDSKDEYFRYCKATPKQNCVNDTCIVHVGPDPCDECACDITIPMKTPREEVTALIYQGISKDNPVGGYKGYLKFRWDSGLPETRFCYPPTTNSEYACRLTESVRTIPRSTLPRLNTIGPAFYRSRGVMCKADYAPYHFPRNYY